MMIDLEQLAESLSCVDHGETYMVVEPNADNTAAGFVTNDTTLAHDSLTSRCISYYLNGKQVGNGADIIVGML